MGHEIWRSLTSRGKRRPDGTARREHAVRQINAAQADVVQWILQLCADGFLTGFSACSLCGGSIYATRRTHGRHVRTYYGCSYHRRRGLWACANDLTIPMDQANRLLLDALIRDVLTPAMVTGPPEDTLAAWRAEGVPALARREGMEARLAQLKVELVYLTNALSGGAPLASVREAIQARERERADLLAQLEHLDGLTRFTAGVDPRALRDDLGARLAHWQGLLERQPTQAPADPPEALGGPA